MNKSKRKYTKKLGRGNRESFNKKKVIISQLSQLNIPHDVRQLTLKNLSASTIQDRMYTRNIKRIQNLLDNNLDEDEIRRIRYSFAFFINSVDKTYEYDDKKTPTNLLYVKPIIQRGLDACSVLLKIHEDRNNLKTYLKKVGYNNFRMVIETAIGHVLYALMNIDDTAREALTDYRGAQLGIETQPDLRNITYKRADSISRRPRTERASVMPRRRSH